jgi:hypothetical protein
MPPKQELIETIENCGNKPLQDAYIALRYASCFGFTLSYKKFGFIYYLAIRYLLRYDPNSVISSIDSIIVLKDQGIITTNSCLKLLELLEGTINTHYMSTEFLKARKNDASISPLMSIFAQMLTFFKNKKDKDLEKIASRLPEISAENRHSFLKSILSDDAHDFIKDKGIVYPNVANFEELDLKEPSFRILENIDEFKS